MVLAKMKSKRVLTGTPAENNDTTQLASRFNNTSLCSKLATAVAESQAGKAVLHLGRTSGSAQQGAHLALSEVLVQCGVPKAHANLKTGRAKVQDIVDPQGAGFPEHLQQLDVDWHLGPGSLKLPKDRQALRQYRERRRVAQHLGSRTKPWTHLCRARFLGWWQVGRAGSPAKFEWIAKALAQR